MRLYFTVFDLINQSINHLFAQDKIKMAITHTCIKRVGQQAISALTVALYSELFVECKRFEPTLPAFCDRVGGVIPVRISP